MSYDYNKISSTSDLLEESFLIYKKGFFRILGMYLISVIAFLPLILILLLSGTLSTVLQNINTSDIINIALGLFGILAVMAGIYTTLVAQAGIFIIIKNSSQRQTIKEAWSEARKYVWHFFAVNTIIGLSIVLGFLLFIIPGIILMVSYSLALWALVDDKYESVSALKRSKELVKGYWWAVCIRFLVIIALFFVSSIPLFFLVPNTSFYQAWDVVSSVINFLLGPFAIIYSYLIYKDLTEIKGESKVKRKKGTGVAIIAIITFFILIFVVGYLSTSGVISLNNARIDTRDTIRVSDIKQIQVALALHYNSADYYPKTLVMGESLSYKGLTYIRVPNNPLPVDGEDCKEDDGYIYEQKNNGKNYSLTFCLGQDKREFKAGYNTVEADKAYEKNKY